MTALSELIRALQNDKIAPDALEILKSLDYEDNGEYAKSIIEVIETKGIDAANQLLDVYSSDEGFERLVMLERYAYMLDYKKYKPLDSGLARIVRDRFFKGCVKYDLESSGAWLLYNGKCWNIDDREAIATVYDIIENAIGTRYDVAQLSNEPEMAKYSLPSVSMMGRVETRLKKLVGVVTNTNLYNDGDDTLNLDNGVIALENGNITAHDSSQKYTYCLPVKYDSSADYTEWESWLLETTGNKQEVVDFLKLAVGYTLTGRTSEECFYYIYGPPRSGKGTFLETIRNMMMGVGKDVDMSTFTEDSNNSGFDLSGLSHQRFITSSEITGSNRLSAGKITRWTGGTMIRCSPKFGKHFEYKAKFKIWLSDNNPLKGTVSERAFWTRARPIEFPNSHLGNESAILKERFSEPKFLESVLNWAIEGSIEWYKLMRKGLPIPMPKVIDLARWEHRDSVDVLAEFMADNGYSQSTAKRDRVVVKLFYEEYRDWRHENRYPPTSSGEVSRQMKAKGFISQGRDVFKTGVKPRCWLCLDSSGKHTR